MFKGAINKLGQYMSETFDFNKVKYIKNNIIRYYELNYLLYIKKYNPNEKIFIFILY